MFEIGPDVAVFLDWKKLVVFLHARNSARAEERSQDYRDQHVLDVTLNIFILKLSDGSETEGRSKLQAPWGIALSGQIN